MTERTWISGEIANLVALQSVRFCLGGRRGRLKRFPSLSAAALAFTGSSPGARSRSRPCCRRRPLPHFDRRDGRGSRRGCGFHCWSPTSVQNLQRDAPAGRGERIFRAGSIERGPASPDQADHRSQHPPKIAWGRSERTCSSCLLSDYSTNFLRTTADADRRPWPWLERT